MKKNKNIKKIQRQYTENMTDEQKQKIKDYRKEYYKRYYIEKKLAIKE